MLTEEEMERIAEAGREEMSIVLLRDTWCEVEIKIDNDGDEYVCVTIPKQLRNGAFIMDDGSNDPTVIHPTHIAVYF